MSDIRVMVCDDSSIMRRLLVNTLNGVDNVSVVSEAIHGQDALDQLPRCKPDLVLMDVLMPVMDGIEAVREIRKVDRKLPVIMLSALTSNGAEATLDAISAGANDFATKPTEAGHISKAVSQLQQELIPKINRLVQAKPAPQPKTSRIGGGVSHASIGVPSTSQSARPVVANVSKPALETVKPAANFPPIEAIGIGVSTGGPKKLFRSCSRGCPASFAFRFLLCSICRLRSHHCS